MTNQRAPYGWREARSSDGETTTFTFRATSLMRLVTMAIFFSPLPWLAQSMTRAAIREGNWGAGNVIVVGFDLLTLVAMAIVVLSYSRIRVVIGGGHVELHDGPFFATHERMTLREASTLNVIERSVGRNGTTRIAVFNFLRDDVSVSLHTTMDPNRVSFVLAQVDAEITRRDPEIPSRMATAGFLPPA